MLRPPTPLKFEQITDGPLNVPLKATSIRFSAGSLGVRWRDDGVAPTPTVGHIVRVHQTFLYIGDLTKIQFNGTVEVTYYHEA